MSLKLGHKLLIYISLILPAKGYDFAYEKIQQMLNNYDNQDYHISTLRKEYSILKSKNFIELKKRYRKPIPVLTQKGKLALKTYLPFKSYGAWDGRWRMVIFDIPESERKYRWALRHKLHELGFAQIQLSSYISPYPLLNPVQRFATDLGVRQHLRLMEISKIDDEQKLVNKAWPLEEINNNYKVFLSRAKHAKKDIYWPLKAKSLEEEFAQIYTFDPHLPQIFLPRDWQGQNAYKIFKEISNSY